MRRTIKIGRNILIIGVMLILYSAVTGFSFTPVQAQKFYENESHFGPSEIIKIIKNDGYQDILCKYEDWICCDRIERTSFVFWTEVIKYNYKNNSSKPITYGISGYNEENSMMFGVVNDPDITKIEVQIDDDQRLTQEEFYDGMFYFTWVRNTDIQRTIQINCYDNDDSRIYEYELSW